MDTVTRIFSLIKQNNETAQSVAEATGIRASVFTEWKKGRSNPSVEKILLLAEYFKVSTDYLLGLSDDLQPRTTVTHDGEELFSNLTDDESVALKAFLKAYREQKKKN